VGIDLTRDKSVFRVQVISDEIVVSLPGSIYTVAYFKPKGSPQLVARRIPSRDDPRSGMTLSDFLMKAWKHMSASPSRADIRRGPINRALFVWLYRRFPDIGNATATVRPETIIRWHRMGFRAWWRWKSHNPGGRPGIDQEPRDLRRFSMN
jgi:hypothetical protein